MKILTTDTHSSIVSAKYGASVAIIISDSLSVTAIAVSYVIMWKIRPCYNGTWLYVVQLLLRNLMTDIW